MDPTALQKQTKTKFLPPAAAAVHLNRPTQLTIRADCSLGLLIKLEQLCGLHQTS